MNRTQETPGRERDHPLWPPYCDWCRLELRLTAEQAPWPYWLAYKAGAEEHHRRVQRWLGTVPLLPLV